MVSRARPSKENWPWWWSTAEKETEWTELGVRGEEEGTGEAELTEEEGEDIAKDNEGRIRCGVEWIRLSSEGTRQKSAESQRDRRVR